MEEQEHKHEYTTHKGEHKKIGIWQISTAVLGVVAILLMIMMFTGKTIGNVVSGETAGKQLTEYLNKQTKGGVEYISSIDKGSLYEVKVSYQGKEIPVYISKDRKYFVQSVVDITTTPSDNSNINNENMQDIIKSDKPNVELFIMTHCPYGIQAEKGLIPVIKELGNKADVKIRFVHYFMHGDVEEQETYNQVCIREEQSTNYSDYLGCFLEDGDGERCLTKIGIDKTKLNICVVNKAKAYYKIDSELSQKYGVQGSPTLVINGIQINSERDSASFLKTICSAFNNAPAECSEKLSSDSPSPGFGYSNPSSESSSKSADVTGSGGCASA